MFMCQESTKKIERYSSYNDHLWVALITKKHFDYLIMNLLRRAITQSQKDPYLFISENVIFLVK